MGATRDLWLRWKMLKLPWRKKFLIGQDLRGNTYWEFKDVRSSDSTKLRRIVKYPRSTYLSDVHISPQWHQWLRHTRSEPPTLQEQAADVYRQTELKGLAMLADRRWEDRKKYFEPVRSGQEVEPTKRLTAAAGGGGGGAERQPTQPIEQTTEQPTGQQSLQPKGQQGQQSTTQDMQEIPQREIHRAQRRQQDGQDESIRSKRGLQKTDRLFAGEEVPTIRTTQEILRPTEDDEPPETKRSAQKDPWTQPVAAAGEGGDWQPGAWVPGSAKKK